MNIETQNALVAYEYGAVSSKYQVMASNKLTAYAAMVYHYKSSAHMIAIYAPESSKEDSWLNIFGQISARLDEIFGGENAFDLYVDAHLEEIGACMGTITQLV